MVEKHKRSEGPQFLDEALDFMRILWTLDESLQRLSRKMLARIGVTGPQRMVLRLIEKFPGISANVISRILHLHASTVSGIVHRLEADNLLRRIASPQDGRVWALELTDAGREISLRDHGTVELAVRNLIDSMPPRDLDQTKEVLSTLSFELVKQIALASPAGDRGQGVGHLKLYSP